MLTQKLSISSVQVIPSLIPTETSRNLKAKSFTHSCLPADPKKESEPGSKIKMIDFGTRKKMNGLKNQLFDRHPEDYSQSPIFGGINSLFYLGQAAQKQALNIVVPPTIILRKDHKNMFLYTKPATK